MPLHIPSDTSSVTQSVISGGSGEIGGRLSLSPLWLAPLARRGDLCTVTQRIHSMNPNAGRLNKGLARGVGMLVLTGAPVVLLVHWMGPGGRFKNTYELLSLRALKISMLYKNRTFQCMGKIFCVEFQRVPLKFHTKYLTHTLKDVDFIQRWKFKSS